MHITADAIEELNDCNTIEGLVKLSDSELQDLWFRFVELYQRRRTRLLEWCIFACQAESDRRSSPDLVEAAWLLVPPLTDFTDAGNSMLLLNHLAYSDLTVEQGKFVDELHLRCLLACACAAKAYGSYFSRYRENQND